MAAESSSRRVTQKDVAERAGVSTSIVSYVINNGPRPVAEATRRRVLDAIEELEYRPNKYAQMLMRNKWESEAATRHFGIVVGGGPSMFMRPFYAGVLSGIYDEAHRRRMRVRFIQFLENLADPILFNELIHPEEIAGLILLAVDVDRVATEHRALVERMTERIDNIVCLERKWENLPAVIFDRSNAARLAVSHLIGLGHRAIGFLGNPDERQLGYRATMMEHELPIVPEWTAQTVVDNTPEDGCRQVMEIMQRAEDQAPSAFFAASDEVAMGAIKGLQQLGLRVPQDVALVGVDDIPPAAYLSPTLTTVRVPKVRMGAHGVRALSDLSDQPADGLPVSTLLPLELIVRESCGARSGAEQVAALSVGAMNHNNL